VTLLRYSLLRLMLLFACLLLLWLVGVRDPKWLLVGTAVGSVSLSYFLLRGPREELARRLAERVQGRLPAERVDVADEDAEADSTRSDSTRPDSTRPDSPQGQGQPE
jgi:hypothetical protein